MLSLQNKSKFLITSFEEAASHPVGNHVMSPLSLSGKSLAGSGSHRVLCGCERLQWDPGEGVSCALSAWQSLDRDSQPWIPCSRLLQGFSSPSVAWLKCPSDMAGSCCWILVPFCLNLLLCLPQLLLLMLEKNRWKTQGEQQIVWPELEAGKSCRDVFPHKTEVLPYNPSASLQLFFQGKTIL